MKKLEGFKGRANALTVNVLGENRVKMLFKYKTLFSARWEKAQSYVMKGLLGAVNINHLKAAFLVGQE